MNSLMFQAHADQLAEQERKFRARQWSGHAEIHALHRALGDFNKAIGSFVAREPNVRQVPVLCEWSFDDAEIERSLGI